MARKMTRTCCVCTKIIESGWIRKTEYFCSTRCLEERKILSDISGPCTYAATDLKFVKIGGTIGNPVRRLKAVQFGNPMPVYLAACSISRPEVGTQRKLVEFKVPRPDSEWFFNEPELLNEIMSWE